MEGSFCSGKEKVADYRGDKCRPSGGGVAKRIMSFWIGTKYNPGAAFWSWQGEEKPCVATVARRSMALCWIFHDQGFIGGLICWDWCRYMSHWAVFLYCVDMSYIAWGFGRSCVYIPCSIGTVLLLPVEIIVVKLSRLVLLSWRINVLIEPGCLSEVS